jgi:(1->4)-alpha-D-glucan 1-alpha-D-glucosylmutase
MAALRIPVATYRLQFNQEFTFRQARELLDYLQQLGVTDVYASPLLQSRKGSNHGYDVTDPTRMDTDAGTESEFEELCYELQRRGMGLVLDIVPNHMAASSENPWWTDVLENGPGSGYSSYFDIDWHPPSRLLDNKVLLPVLADTYGRVLENQELRPAYRNGSFVLQYFEESFPLSPNSYHLVLKHRLDVLEKRLGEGSSAYQEYRGIVAALCAPHEREPLAPEATGQRRLQAEATKERLRRLYEAEPGIRRFIAENLRSLCGKKRRPASFRPLDRLLAEQPYILEFWQNPNQEINYRRFFTITDLVGVRAEDPFVFEATHTVIFRLVERGVVTGLRIDHIDGLRDPLGYLQRLQDRVASFANGQAPGFYVIAEKILSPNEKLSAGWPIHGTTGYDFLNAVNRLFIHPSGAGEMERIFTRFLGEKIEYADVLYHKKKLVMATLLAVEMRALARHLSILAAQDRYARDVPRAELSLALTEVTACLSVYRTYIRGLDIPAEAKAEVGRALEEARRRRPNLNPSALDFVRQVLLLADADHLSPVQREARLGFVMRWQQFTGPIVAKGLEDTVFYAYTPLISLNEVGGDPRPSPASRQDFPQFLQDRARFSPYTLNTTMTHDTKRAEDVRARINVLSDIPEEWQRHLRLWSRLNAPHRRTVGRHRVPDPVEETLLYQTLLGAWPLRQDEVPEFRPRLKEYVIKATREAMVHTRWTRPNFEHEEALTQFVESILDVRKSGRFLNDFLRFQEKISYYGMLNGAAQALLKIVCPGVPDFYQGSELWDFRLVDPDNRRPVDFGERIRLLESIAKEGVCPNAEFLRCLCQCWRDSRIKLYVVWKALNFRRQRAQLFLDGGYLSPKAHGERQQNVFALMRYTKYEYTLAAVPRWLARTKAPMNAGNMQKYWGSGFFLLPPKTPRKWFNVLTGEHVLCEEQSGRASLPLQRLFASFPVALLSGEIDAG